MMKDESMAETEAETETEGVAEIPAEEKEPPFQSMQTELHKKGAVLTKAWADLFSFLTKYQAELMVKENAVGIAEREVDVRKSQLSDLKLDSNASEEVLKLQDSLHTKERLLTKAQSELSATEHMLRRVQSDLTSHMELLEKSRSELLEKQSDLVRYRGDLERLRSEVTIKEEQILIKDNLLKKLQAQLMKENSELKEQLKLKEQALEAERRTLELERRAHELTKRSSRERSRQSSGAPTVIEIPDSPPTIDLSEEHGDFGLSNIISLAEAQSRRPRYDQSMRSPTIRRSSLGSDNSYFSPQNTLPLNTSHSTTTISSKTNNSPWQTAPPTISTPPSKYPESAPLTSTAISTADHFSPDHMAPATSSDTIFPSSSVDEEDNKGGIDTSLMQVDPVDSMQTDIPAQMTSSGPQPGTPSSGTSDSNQGPVPVSGPYPASPGLGTSAGLGDGGDGKLMHTNRRATRKKPAVCKVCGMRLSSVSTLKGHMRRHTGEKPYECSICNMAFAQGATRNRHMRCHTGERPFSCKLCGRAFSQSYALRIHYTKKHSGKETEK